MNNEYDIGKAFRRIEETLIKSYKRNLTRHFNEENLENMNWTAWQTEELKSLEHFRKENKDLFKKDFSTINSDIEELIKQSYENGKLDQEKIILEAITNGNFNSQDKNISKLWHIYNNTKNNRIKKKQLKRIYEKVNQVESTFFKVNERKLKALIKEATGDIQKAENTILRFTNDKYRKVIFDAQVYANTGAGTIQQAVDMATKDFLSAGINNIQYSNGAMVNIAAYADMAIRTATKRAYLQGEGEKRQEWGVYTVLVPNRGGGCPYCIKFQGKVFVDDVWSGGTEAESKETGYPLLSTAVKAKLFHPNCKDTTVTYFPGISSEVTPPTKEQLETKIQNYKKDQKLNYIDRNIEKYKRLELGSTYNENIEKYHNKRLQWQKYKEEFKGNSNISFQDISEYDFLSSIIRNENLKTFDKFYYMRYNNIEEYNLMKGYSQLYRKGQLPKKLDYKTYKNNLNNIDWKAVGLSPDKLNRHFEKHAEELGLKTVEEYDNFAKEFMNKEIKDNIKGFVSKDGYVFKYDEENNIFGDAKPNGITETVFKPKRKKAYWKEQVEKYGK